MSAEFPASPSEQPVMGHEAIAGWACAGGGSGKRGLEVGRLCVSRALGLFFAIAAGCSGVCRFRDEQLNHAHSIIWMGRWWDREHTDTVVGSTL